MTRDKATQAAPPVAVSMRDHAAEAAAIIAGTANAPPEMTAFLRQQASILRSNYQMRQDWPTRTMLLDRLSKIEAAAMLLATELRPGRDVTQDAALLMMQAHGFDVPAIGTLAIQTLPKVAEAADSARRRIKMGRGKMKQLPNSEAPSPHIICAATIAFLWQHARNQPPGHTSQKAHSACENLWQAAELPRARAGAAESLTGWKPHLQAVNRAVQRIQFQETADPAFSRLWHGIMRSAGLHLKRRK